MKLPQAWEMGSEFHSMDAQGDPHPDSVMPLQGELFVSGRAALLSLIDRLGASGTLWLPEYVCPDVAQTLVRRVGVRWYQDYPDDPSADFDSIQAQPGDFVLVQDTFGLGDPEQWRQWTGHNGDVTLVEDITHNCTQERFLESPAELVFASLRKTLPVADGGIIFSRGGGLRRPATPANPGAHLKLEAMILKAGYLGGQAVDKQAFRDLQVKGEEELARAQSGTCLVHTLQMLQSLHLGELRSQWARNNKHLRHILQNEGGPQALPLNSRSGRSATFNTVLKCGDSRSRDRLRTHLMANNVFSAIHWRPNAQTLNASRRASALGELVLTVPTDFRYGKADIERLAGLIIEGVK